MSILIKGMEMPTSCGKCGWYSFIEEVCRANRCEIPASDDVYLQRHKDCPLIPVPPHGRLIDADEFIKRVSELVRKAKTDGFDLGAAWYTAFIRHIELALTVIPAEKEDYNETPD